MQTELRLISSMATRSILELLIERYRRERGEPVAIVSVGGVEAARRVREGEAFDVVALAADALAKLAADGHVSSVKPFARSPMAFAVRRGHLRPDLGDEDAVRRFLAAAPTIGFSTGPSGDHLLGLLRGWGLDEPERLVQAKPGVPVASLVAQGAVEVGFQQMSELMNEPAIEIAGALPPSIAKVTTFSLSIAKTTLEPARAAALIDFLISAECAADIERGGMAAP